MKAHNLKTWPEYFKEVVSGNKTFEVRKNDRDFQVGDLLILDEFDPNSETGYTGYSYYVEVIYILQGGSFGIDADTVIMGITPTKYNSL